MSLHSSLKSSSTLVRKRSVMKRTERLARLTELGRWDETKSVYGLPKTKLIGVVKLGKKKKKKKEGEEEAAK